MDENYNSKLQQSDYQNRYYSIDATKFIECFQFSLSEIVEADVLQYMAAAMVKTTGTSEDIESNCRDYIAKFLSKLNYAMRDLKDGIEERFFIPGNVLLPQDFLQETQFTEVDKTRLLKEIETLEQRAAQAVTVTSLLNEELEEMEEVKKLKDMNKSLQFTLDVLKANMSHMASVDTLKQVLINGR